MARILIIEDDYQNRLLLKQILEHQGFDVLEACNGAEGIEKAYRHLPDLVLLDIQLPVMDGYAVLEILRSRPETKYIKVVAITAFAMESDRERAFQAGMDDYIAKPIDTREFARLVRDKWLR